MQYWLNCAHSHKNAEFTEHELRDLCDSYFIDDKTIYTGHFLDRY